MTKSFEHHLRAVPSLPRERRESLRERFGEADDAQLEQLMQREFGGKVVDIACRQLYVFESRVKPGVVAMDHEGYHVAGLYMGIEEVVERKVSAVSKPVAPLAIVDTRVFPLAVFSTAIGPLFSELSSEELKAADMNDTGSTSMYHCVGVRLDQPVTFGPLENRFDDRKELPHVKLRVIQ